MLSAGLPKPPTPTPNRIQPCAGTKHGLFPPFKAHVSDYVSMVGILKTYTLSAREILSDRSCAHLGWWCLEHFHVTYQLLQCVLNCS